MPLNIYRPRLSNGQKRMKFICAFDECHSRDLTGKRIREKRITLYNKVNKVREEGRFDMILYYYIFYFTFT